MPDDTKVQVQSIFTVRYKHGGATRERHFYATNEANALEKAKTFCQRTNSKVIFVWSFISDLDTITE